MTDTFLLQTDREEGIVLRQNGTTWEVMVPGCSAMPVRAVMEPSSIFSSKREAPMPGSAYEFRDRFIFVGPAGQNKVKEFHIKQVLHFAELN